VSRVIATLARVAVGAVLLVVLVAGVPVLLAAFGNPVAELIDAFGDELASEATLARTALTSLLVAVGWSTWAMVTISVVVEAVAAARGTMARPLVVLPGVQGLAHWLVSSVLLAGTLTAAAPTSAAALPPIPTPASATPTSADAQAATVVTTGAEAATRDSNAPSRPASVAVTYEVTSRSETWWSLAERLLGAGSRWQELVETNAGRTMPDGTVISSADPPRPRPGWKVLLPTGAIAAPTNVDDVGGADPGPGRGDRDASTTDAPDAHGPDVETMQQVVVVRGDTLWDLADEHLDDPYAYPEIAEANFGRPQPDGRALTDPNLIEPGWVLDIPAAHPAWPTPVPHPAGDPTPADAGHDEPTSDPSPTQPKPTAGRAGTEPATSPTNDAASTNDAAPTDAAAPGVTPPGRGSPTASTAPPTSTPAPPPPAPPPSTPEPPVEDAAGEDVGSGTSIPVPAGLLAAGLATAGVVVVLDRLRRVQRQRRQPGHVFPTPDPELEQIERALRAGTDRSRAERLAIALQVAAAGAGLEGLGPIRWVTVDDHHVRIHLGEPAPPPPGFTAEADSWVTAADPALVASLAVGSLDPLPLLCPIGTTPDGADVLVDLEAARVTSIDGPPERVSGLLRSMAVAVATSMWGCSPEVILVGLSGAIAELEWVRTEVDLAAGLDRLHAHRDQVSVAMHSAGRTIAQARASGATPDAWDPLVVISADPPWEAHGHTLRELAQHAPTAFAAVVPAANSHADPAPGVVLEIDDDGLVAYPGLEVATTASCLTDDDLRAVQALLTQAAIPATDVPAARDHAPPGVREVSPLTDELAQRHVLVRIMGDVTIERIGGSTPEPVVFDRARSAEAIVYLACREEGRGVAIDDVRAALWPDGRSKDQTVRNTITRARSGLGTDPVGVPYLPAPVEGRYRLDDRVVTDFEVFWSLRRAADAVDDPTAAAALLEEALHLVRGEPLLGAGRNYAWTAPLVTTIVVAVVDAADELGEIRLGAGDPRGAERAARAGLAAAPGEERLYRILMRAAAALESKPMIERLYRELLDVLADPDVGIEPAATISDETIGVFNELMGSRRSA
jgi:nucleoid-associated protein YgaU/DNA-binding SARP family transcriptional activator